MKRSQLEKLKKASEDARQIKILNQAARHQHDLTREDTNRALASSERANKISERANEIAESANSISRSALKSSRRSNIIAISAIIFSAATAIGIAIFEYLTKNAKP